MTKEQAKAIVEKLVNRYTEQQKSYHAADYNETKTRRDFIDPFFKALGWDMDNEQDVAEPYREVIHEDKIKIQGKTKSPDYGFRLQGAKQQLFFVEAKKPSVSLKTNKESSFQIRRYGWNSKVSVSILTNFEDFIVYDCSKKPNINDSASVARLKTISYDQYLQEFDFIYDTFSREAVVKGRFDSYVKSDTAKKGTQTLDKEFVASLDTWRQYLATDLAKSNLKLNEDELNFAVQLIIDRLIFLRFCEDRGVETYGQLKAATSKGNAYENLHVVFQAADDKYNSGLFDFEKDKITHNLKVTNKVIKNIVEELYYPLSQYDFKALPVEVLGNAYEQFLGKVIRIDKAHHAVIEEKPEVRKAGGVFYTPQYIVDYIVENTVGKLIEGKTPKEIEKIKIVDPACGSGSFLLGAFDYLLKYHINYYYKNPPSAKSGIITPNGTLSTAEKKKIILNNIFGVDLDANAVEVSKLSLLLKCMEGETEASIKQQITMFHERVLPDLDNNIKDGNSLIDTDIYDSEMELGFEKKIKPFSWKKAFPEVFKKRISSNELITQELKSHYNKVKNFTEDADKLINKLNNRAMEPEMVYGDHGGFDVVIGNPPYVRQELLSDFKKYFESHYKVYNSTADLYSYFIEKGKSLLRTDGYFGIIVANKFMRANYGEPLRKWLKQVNLIEITDFGDLPVFQGATTYPCILIYRNSQPEKQFKFSTIKTLQFSSLETEVKHSQALLSVKSLDDGGWNLASELEQNLLKKIKSSGIPLGEYVKGKIYYGIKTGYNEAFVIDLETKKALIKEDKKSNEIIKPFLAGRDIKRYQNSGSDKYLIFTKRGIDIDKYPAIKKYLEGYKKELTPKPKTFKGSEWPGRKPGTYKWYEIQDAVDYYLEFEKPKILIPDIALSLQGAYDTNKNYCVNTAYIIPVDDKFLLSILNSKLVTYYYASISPSIRGGYLRFIRQYLETIPIIINDKYKNVLASQTDLLLALNEELKISKLPSNIDQIKQRIEHSEDKINQLVYELYDLTEDEIKIVEESVK